MAIIVFLLALTGCNSQTTQQKDSKKSSINISPAAGIFSAAGLTTVSSAEVDIDGDGRPDQIVSYTSAEKMPDGTMAWDDGQRWVLLATCSNKQYILFDGYVQLAHLKFIAHVDSGEFHITTLQEGQFLTIYDYYFDKEKEMFVGSEKFSLDGAEKMYYPDYQVIF